MTSNPDEKTKAGARKARLAAELRANLQKRKNQARLRKTPDGKSSGAGVDRKN